MQGTTVFSCSQSKTDWIFPTFVLPLVGSSEDEGASGSLRIYNDEPTYSPQKLMKFHTKTWRVRHEAESISSGADFRPSLSRTSQEIACLGVCSTVSFGVFDKPFWSYLGGVRGEDATTLYHTMDLVEQNTQLQAFYSIIVPLGSLCLQMQFQVDSSTEAPVSMQFWYRVQEIVILGLHICAQFRLLSRYMQPFSCMDVQILWFHLHPKLTNSGSSVEDVQANQTSISGNLCHNL